MTIAGVIAEYNPFHNGHLHHLRETRRASGCDGMAVCLAGNFTQRGEAAVLSKWTRARMALLCGADVVFELPALFAVRTADFFARGGVGVLAGLGCDVLSFGCETDDMALLAKLAALREDEPEEISRETRRRLDAGMSHARARGEAVAAYLGLPAKTLNAPNLALAVEYVRCLRHTATRPLAIRRLGDYHDGTLSHICSATAVRRALAAGEDVSQAVPAQSRACRWIWPSFTGCGRAAYPCRTRGRGWTGCSCAQRGRAARWTKRLTAPSRAAIRAPASPGRRRTRRRG